MSTERDLMQALAASIASNTGSDEIENESDFLSGLFCCLGAGGRGRGASTC